MITINSKQNRRSFLKRASLLPLCAAAGAPLNNAVAAFTPIKRVGGAKLKVALNAYSFSKDLNDHVKGRGAGMSLFDLLDFCAQHNFDAVDATGYFFPGYPNVPEDSYISEFKRRAFQLGLDICGTGVRNNFTDPDPANRAADVKHIKEWVEVAAKLGAPVLRVFVDTQRRDTAWDQIAKGHTWDQVAAWISANLKECAEHGKKYGVLIGVQNHGDFVKTGEQHIKLLKMVDSEWCGAIVDTGYYMTKDPYADIEIVTPFAVNWQVKESPFGKASAVRTDLKRLVRLIRDGGYRGYIPIETLSVAGRDYVPQELVPKFLKEVQDAIAATA
jgi:sugar phosphate isomerase/epimerase